jgi:hypothetical protein
MTPLDKIKLFLTNVSDVSLGYNEITFFDPLNLQEEQVGFSFDTEGNSLITGNDGDWKKEWLAIANDEVGDPIMIDTSTPELTVLSAQHGQGAWEPFTIADSLDNFQNIISILNKISENRTTPVDLGQNPIPDAQRQNALNHIKKQNPHTEIWFWEGYFENDDMEEEEEGSKKPWWKFW